MTKLTDGTVCLVCPDGEWGNYWLIGSSLQRRRHLFIYLLFLFAFFRREEESARQARVTLFPSCVTCGPRSPCVCVHSLEKKKCKKK